MKRVITTAVAALLVTSITPAHAQDPSQPQRNTAQTAPRPATPPRTPEQDDERRARMLQEEAAHPAIPLKVQIVISRWQGEKKISSEPYALMVNASQSASRPADLARLRMGAEVPVSAISGLQEMAKQTGVAPAAPIQYKPIGTNIDCTARADPNGRFTLQLTIEDSSVFADDHPRPGTVASSTTPVFRSFRLTNTALLRDGQSTQFTTATDKVSGEIVKVDVTLNVIK